MKRIAAGWMMVLLVWILSGCSGVKKPDAMAVVFTNGSGDGSTLGASYQKQGFSVIRLDLGKDALEQERIETLNAGGCSAVPLAAEALSMGGDALDEQIGKAAFAVLSANVRDEEDEPEFQPSVVITLEGGVRVGLFGLTNPDASHIPGLHYRSGDALTACAEEQVKALRDRDCGVIICMADLGAAQSRLLLQAVKGIDLLLDGSGEGALYEQVGKAYLLAPAAGRDGAAWYQDGRFHPEITT